MVIEPRDGAGSSETDDEPVAVVKVQTVDHGPGPASLIPRTRHHQRRPPSNTPVAVVSNAPNVLTFSLNVLSSHTAT